MGTKPLFAILVAAAQIAQVSAQPAAPGPPAVPSADQRAAPAELVRRAIVAVESRRSVAARVRQTVQLFGHQLVGSGIYLEQQSASGLQFRLELTMQTAAGKPPTSLLKICDGRYLWGYRQMAGVESISRVDVVRIAQGLDEAGRMPIAGIVDGWPGLGGLPKLLRGLNASFDFDSLEPVQLWDQLPAWKISGGWKRDKLAIAMPEQRPTIEQGQPADMKKLPSPLPTRVLLLLGRDDLFPYRLEYWRDVPADDDQTADRGRAAGLIVAIDWFEVRFDAPLNPTRFIYSPGARPFDDATREFLERLGLK